MKLAKIILPMLDNHGADLFLEHRGLQHILLTEFGGFTQTEGAGCWKSPTGKKYTDRVMVYEVAMERAAAVQLRQIARDLAISCRQESVMIVTPCGDVEFVKPGLTVSAAEA